MKFHKTPIDGLFVLEPNTLIDSCGSFLETYNRIEFTKHGICDCFVQDNQSLSHKGVLRGVHAPKYYPQSKIVRVLNGSIWDVAVDLRKQSSTYGKWYGLELNSHNKKQLYLPESFAHGYLTLEDNTEILMKVSTYYHPGDEVGFLWNDTTINIEWPLDTIKKLILAEKDINWKSFKETFSE